MYPNMIFLIGMCLMVVASNGVAAIEPEVVTNLGVILGVSGEFQDTNVSIFRGIPYAQPPVGRLRFRPPVPVEKWEGRLDATIFGDMCPQSEIHIHSVEDRLFHTTISEDCLTLDIYTPEDTGNGMLDVMVFFYHGAFVYGTTMLYDGSVLAAEHNVIVVNVNYRVGAIGFLSTMDRYARGNYGLLDQQLAIKWVKDNIDAFGGDPDKITLFGRAAGAMCVGFQMLSPSNEGLFKRGISHSGAATSFFMAANPSLWARRLGSALNCTDGDDHRKLLSCLRTKSWQEIVDNSPGRRIADPFNRVFLPVIDGDFLPEAPEKLAQTYSNFTKLDYLLGFNSNEGKYAHHLMPNLKEDFVNTSGLTSAEFQKFASDFISPYYQDDENLLQNAVLYHYTEWRNPSSDTNRLDNYLKLVGDQAFVSPTLTLALKRVTSTSTEDGKTFLCQFSHDGEPINGGPYHYPAWLEGSPHGAEQEFIYGGTYLRSDEYTDDQRTLSSKIMKYWTNFAKTGNPNSGEPVNVAWPEYTASEQKYLDLDLNSVTVDHHVKADDIVFWHEQAPFLASQSCPPLPTDCITTVGNDLGLALTLSQTSTLIQAFIIIVILLVAIMFLMCGAICAYHRKVDMMDRESKKINDINGRLESVVTTLDSSQSTAAADYEVLEDNTKNTTELD